MINKLLIANRGEIACRVSQTAKRMGLRTVAVYSEADKAARHVELCDEAIFLGPAAASESYLRIDKVIEACLTTGADAVHPGYGFLSENASFAEALDANGIRFVGPTAETIRAMGSKSAAKDLMQAAGVPTTPGYQGADQSLSVFQAEAEKIGYPVLLKATAGGGGKGMRAVDRPKDLEAALQSAQREAKSAFGDDRFLIEKYVSDARHLEVQVFGDGQGNVVHLFERDCSVQRRHQKVIEEAPAPDLPSSVRRALHEAGVNAARAVQYRGAGTVEFLYDKRTEAFYFMEMNTRLQVEHPVSEMLTGLDFVEWQLRIAAGEGLPLTQEEIRERGHAFEARLYAENPAKRFAPSVGTLTTLRLPEGSSRVDSGVREGDTITPHYDPMIAKIITHNHNRAAALNALERALNQTRVAGLETNAGFLSQLTRDHDFHQGQVSTNYIETHKDTLFTEQSLAPAHWAVAALWLHTQAAADGNSADPWEHLGGFRVNQPPEAHYWLDVAGAPTLLTLKGTCQRFNLRVEPHAAAANRRKAESPSEGLTLSFQAMSDEAGWHLIIDGADAGIGFAARHKAFLRVWVDAHPRDFGLTDPLSGDAHHQTGAGSLTAPIPGIIVAHVAEVGATVEAGEPLLILEAMKMEHTIRAPYTGLVKSFAFQPGEQVRDGDQLIDFEEKV